MARQRYPFDNKAVGNINDFFVHIRKFCFDRLKPGYLGVSKIETRIELDPDGKLSVVIETNRQLNDRARGCVTDVVKSFIDGYIARGKRQDRGQADCKDFVEHPGESPMNDHGLPVM